MQMKPHLKGEEMNRSRSRNWSSEEQEADHRRYGDRLDAPMAFPSTGPAGVFGLAPDPRRNGPGYNRGYGERDDSLRGRDRGFFDKAVDEVQSWFGDEDADRRRERDHRGRGPRNYRRSDQRISEDVHQAMTDDHHLDASDIEVAVLNGEVTLDGTVDSRMAKRHAEDCADAVSGVEHVQNNLRVRQTATPES